MSRGNSDPSGTRPTGSDGPKIEVRAGIGNQEFSCAAHVRHVWIS